MNEYIKTYFYNYSKPKIIYDLNILREKLIFIREAADENKINILFAVKSFPSSKILEFVNPYIDGFDISNTLEYSLLPKNSSYKFISVNDPTINFEDIPIYMSEKDKIIFYNLDFLSSNIIDELQIYNRNTNLQFGIRLSHTTLGITSSSYRTGVLNSRFGVNLQKVGKLLPNTIISGLHLHNGSEMNNIESYIFIANAIISFLEKNNINVHYINFGGGLHTLSDNEILILFMELKNLASKKIAIFFEPGHLFSKNVGYAITKVKNVKEIEEGKYIVTTDVSYECNLKWSIPQYYPLCKEQSGQYVDVTFYGSSCFEHDIILNCKIDINDFRQNILRNKLIVFQNINGYALAWNHSFNGIPQAEIYFHDLSK